MGTFIEYSGEMNIPKEKLEILSKQMEKVMNYGGMMDLEFLDLFGFRLELMKPFHLNPEGRSLFCYNYFEENFWETGCYKWKEGKLHTEKVGCYEFNDVSLAAYYLLFMYDENPGCVAVDNRIMADTVAVGWLNHLLGTRFSMKPFFQLFDIAEKYALDGWSPDLKEEEILYMLPENLEYDACGTDFADLMYIFHGTQTLDLGDVLPGSYPDDVKKAREAVRSFLNREGEDSLETLWTFLKSDREKRMEMTDLSPLPELSLILPARVFVFLAAKQKGLNFWKLWKDLREQVYQDQEMKSYAGESLEKTRRERAEEPAEPVSTLDFLQRSETYPFGTSSCTLSDDDRLYWWDPESDEVTLSEKMDAWLRDLSHRHRTIMETPEKNPAESDSFLKDFVTVLGRVNEGYRNVKPFHSMFYEFIENGSKKEYTAAVELLKELARENWEQEDGHGWSGIGKNAPRSPGRMRMRRYLSVMANTKLRKKYFGF